MSAVRPAVIPLARLGHQRFVFNWKGQNGVNLDLTGYALAVEEFSDGMDTAVTAALTDQSQGQVTGLITWLPALKDGRQNWFRLRATKSGLPPVALPERLWVEVT